MPKLRRIITEIKSGENLELYTVMVASILLLVLSLFGIANQDWTSSLTIAVLALVALSLLGTRHRLDSIQRELSQSPHSVFLKKFPEDFKSDLKKARDLWVVGANLATTSNIFWDDFDAILKQGGTIRILIIDPKNTATTMSAMRILRGETTDSVSAIILISLARLCRLRGKHGDKIEIRTINYVPSFGMFAIDIESQKAVFYVEHYGYRLEHDLPKFVMRPDDDEWFHLFRQQLFALWQDSAEWPYSESQTRKLIGGSLEAENP